jgi:hypothetical protein
MSFFQKPIGATLVLGTAIGTPYVLFETEPGMELRKAVSQGTEDTPAGFGGTASGNSSVVNSPSEVPLADPTGYRSAIAATGSESTPLMIAQPPIDLRQVIRFDISPDFVYRSFPRVSTVLSDLSLDGLRVPLVSGTSVYDVAGSLTYSFDINKSLRRIQFQGVTGDPGPLFELMTKHYRLTPERSLGGQLLTARWNNRVTSFIHIAPAPVVSSQQPNARFAFYMEINKPTDSYGLSHEASQMLMQAQAAKRFD